MSQPTLEQQIATAEAKVASVKQQIADADKKTSAANAKIAQLLAQTGLTPVGPARDQIDREIASLRGDIERFALQKQNFLNDLAREEKNKTFYLSQKELLDIQKEATNAKTAANANALAKATNARDVAYVDALGTIADLDKAIAESASMTATEKENLTGVESYIVAQKKAIAALQVQSNTAPTSRNRDQAKTQLEEAKTNLALAEENLKNTTGRLKRQEKIAALLTTRKTKLEKEAQNAQKAANAKAADNAKAAQEQAKKNAKAAANAAAANQSWFTKKTAGLPNWAWLTIVIGIVILAIIVALIVYSINKNRIASQEQQYDEQRQPLFQSQS